MLWVSTEGSQQGITHRQRGVQIVMQYRDAKKIWYVICSLTAKGYTADTAIDKVYEVYGKSKSVSAILDAMIADKQARIERF